MILISANEYGRRRVREGFFRGREKQGRFSRSLQGRIHGGPGRSLRVRTAGWLTRAMPAGLAAGLFALAGVWCGTAIAATTGVDSNPTLAKIMGLLAQRRQGRTEYVEKDYFALLDRPLKSSGVLIYVAPDHLEKRTLKPKPESLVLDHGAVTIKKGDRTYHFDLSAYPQAAPYVDAIRATLAGDLPALERVFEVSFTGTLAHWQLALEPRSTPMARSVQRITIDGARADVSAMEIDKPNGDRSVMTMAAPRGSPGR